MSTIDVFIAELGIAFAIIMLRYEKPNDLIDYIALTIVTWGAVMSIFSLTGIAVEDHWGVSR